jgi:hypothetical protein
MPDCKENLKISAAIRPECVINPLKVAVAPARAAKR